MNDSKITDYRIEDEVRARRCRKNL